MKILFRVLAACIVVIALWAVGANLRDYGIEEGFDWGAVTGVLGVVLILPTLTAYALFGEAAANRILVALTRIVSFPGAVVERFLARHIELPPEFRSQEPDDKLLDKTDKPV